MNTCNLEIPECLRTLHTHDLECLVITATTRPVTKEDVLPLLEARYDTKRSARASLGQIEDKSIDALNDSVTVTGKAIDFKKVYSLITNKHRTYCTVKQ